MKIVSALLTSAVFASAAASAQPVNAPAPTAGVKAFLDVLNSGNGKLMEQMSPAEARQVLIELSKALFFLLLKSLIKRFRSKVKASSWKSWNLKTLKERCLSSCSSMVAAGYWVTSLLMNAWSEIWCVNQALQRFMWITRLPWISLPSRDWPSLWSN